VARDKQADPVEPARHRGRAQPRSGDLIRAERRYPTAWAKPTVSATTATPLVLFSAMRRDGALVFKVYESAKDGRARFTAHSSFVDPTTATGRAAAPEHRGENACVFDS